MRAIAETNCTITHEGKSFSASGAWLTEQGGAVYIIRRDNQLTVETWNGDLISANIQVVPEWIQYSRAGHPYRMRSIRFSVAGNICFSGRYSPDWAELCRVKRVRGRK